MESVLENDILASSGGVAMEALRQAFNKSEHRYAPEESPFGTLFADITHRCNMDCHNCYIPERELPDMPAEWLFDVIQRLPRRTRIRLVGAEPTVREDLPDLIRGVRKLGHLPVILSNGLKLARDSYVKKLRQAGLGTVYLSLNGGLRDDLYEDIDGMPVAERKLKALDNLIAQKMHVTTGTILVPGSNLEHLPEFLEYLLARGVRDIHLRSIGQLGRHMEARSLDLDSMESLLRDALPPGGAELKLSSEFSSSRDFQYGRAVIQLTEWPELGSLDRGRIAPDGMLEPMFESVAANGYNY